MTTTSFEDPYLQSVLDKLARKEGFQQPKYLISSGSKPGDNYSCRIFRTVITESSESEQEKSLSLIFKVSPLSKARQEKISLKQINKTEADVYETVLPTLNELLNKYGVVKSPFFPNTARCYLSDQETDWCDILVLEDKTTDGYRMIGDHKSLDADHCRQIIKILALWHASSLALKHHEPETAERLRELITKEVIFVQANNPVMNELKHSISEGLAMLQEPIKTGNAIYEKLENIIQNFANEMVRCNELPSDLCCIIQGDCWFNNMMYKYNTDGSLQDVCLLDHQITRFASPAVELSYLFFLGTTKDVRDASYDELISFYHSEVSTILKKMECDPEKIFPWDLLQEHLKKYGRMGVLLALSGLHVILVDSSENNLNLHADDDNENIFAGRAKASDPKKREAIARRMTDVVIDAYRWTYI